MLMKQPEWPFNTTIPQRLKIKVKSPDTIKLD